MSKNLVIFGLGEIAEIAAYYFEKDSEYRVQAFCVDPEYIRSELFCEKPVVPFDQIEKLYPPHENQLFIGMGYKKMNTLREEKYFAAKKKGYLLASYISSKMTFLGEKKFGDNCLILEDNTIQPFVTIGNNVTLWSGNHIGHHSQIGNHCFISSHVVISGGVVIHENCFLGVNSTLKDHITIGKHCLVGAGATILKDTKEYSVYRGPETSPLSKRSDQIQF